MPSAPARLLRDPGGRRHRRHRSHMPGSLPECPGGQPCRGSPDLVVYLPRTDQRLTWHRLPPSARPRPDVPGRHRQPVPLGSRSRCPPGSPVLYWQRPRIQPDTQELLATTLPACLVSNIDRADLVAALAHHGLARRFAHLVTSQDARAYKPRPEMFRTALALLGLGPDEVIHARRLTVQRRCRSAAPRHTRSLGQPQQAPGTHSRPDSNLRNQRPQPAGSPARRLSAATIAPLPVTHHLKN